MLFIKNYGETGRNAVAMSLNRVYGYAPLWGRAAAAGGACAARAVGRPTAASREPTSRQRRSYFTSYNRCTYT